MPKANPPPPKLQSRILNSKPSGRSNVPPASRHVIQQATSSRNSNMGSLRPLQPDSATLPARLTRKPSTAVNSLEDFDFSEQESPRNTNTGSRKVKAKAKAITNKEKRQAAVAAAEDNAARLKARNNWEESDEEGSSNDDRAFDPIKALDLRAATTAVAEDDGSDDSNDDPEAERRPSLARSRRIDSDQDDDDDDRAGLENDDSDDNDPANSPIRQHTRKDKGATFTDAVTISVTSKLPPKRSSAPKKKSTNGAASSGASSSPGRSSISSPPRTPRKSHGGRVRLGDQTPTTTGLVKAAASETRQALILEDAFPDRTAFVDQCKAIFLSRCADFQATVQTRRFNKSRTYRGLVLALISSFCHCFDRQLICISIKIRQKLSQVRQEVRIAALAKTALHFGISSGTPAAEIVGQIEKTAYIFGNINEFKQPYGNPIIQTMINSLFFEGKRKSDALSNPVPWNPMPLPVIALVATAVHSVLDDWETGKNQAAKNKFSRDNYESVYRLHLANLRKFQEKAPKALAQLRTSLWETAWASSGSAPLDDISVTIEDGVFVEAEAMATF